MPQSLIEKIKQIITANRQHRAWIRVVACLTVIAVFCTAYALMLPALGLTNDADESVAVSSESQSEAAVDNTATDESVTGNSETQNALDSTETLSASDAAETPGASDGAETPDASYGTITLSALIEEINTLPAADSVASMSDEEIAALQAQLEAINEAYNALSEEDQLVIDDDEALSVKLTALMEACGSYEVNLTVVTKPVSKPSDFGIATQFTFNGRKINSYNLSSNTVYNLTQDITISRTLHVAKDCTVTINLNGHTINRNLAGKTAQLAGCVIFVAGNGTLIIDGASDDGTRGKLTGGNNTQYGGGIYTGGSVTLSNVEISGNTCALNGGGVAQAMTTADNSALTINNCIIQDNGARNGGGVYVYRGTCSIADTTICGNTASKGGGVDVWDAGECTLTNVAVTDNTASSWAGGVAFGGSSLTINGGRVKGNTTSNSTGTNYANDISTHNAYSLTTDGACEIGSISLGHMPSGHGAVTFTGPLQQTEKIEISIISDDGTNEGKWDESCAEGLFTADYPDYNSGVALSDPYTYFKLTPKYDGTYAITYTSENELQIVHLGVTYIANDDTDTTKAEDFASVTLPRTSNDYTVEGVSVLADDSGAATASLLGDSGAATASLLDDSGAATASLLDDSEAATATLLTASNNTYTRDGYTFTGWNTEADGTGTAYAAGDTITLSGAVTLYAQWEEIQVETRDLEVTKIWNDPDGLGRKTNVAVELLQDVAWEPASYTDAAGKVYTDFTSAPFDYEGSKPSIDSELTAYSYSGEGAGTGYTAGMLELSSDDADLTADPKGNTWADSFEGLPAYPTDDTGAPYTEVRELTGSDGNKYKVTNRKTYAYYAFECNENGNEGAPSGYNVTYAVDGGQTVNEAAGELKTFYYYEGKYLTEKPDASSDAYSTYETVALPADATSLTMINTCKGEYSFRKQWKDSDGNDLDVNPGKATLHIYRSLNKEALSGFATYLYEESELAVDYFEDYDEDKFINQIVSAVTSVDGSGTWSHYSTVELTSENNFYNLAALAGLPGDDALAGASEILEMTSYDSWEELFYDYGIEGYNCYDYVFVEESVDGFATSYTATSNDVNETYGDLEELEGGLEVDASYEVVTSGGTAISPRYIIETGGSYDNKDAAVAKDNSYYVTNTAVETRDVTIKKFWYDTAAATRPTSAMVSIYQGQSWQPTSYTGADGIAHAIDGSAALAAAPVSSTNCNDRQIRQRSRPDQAGRQRRHLAPHDQRPARQADSRR